MEETSKYIEEKEALKALYEVVKDVAKQDFLEVGGDNKAYGEFMLGVTNGIIQNLPNIISQNKQRDKQTQLLDEQIVTMQKTRRIQLVQARKDCKIKEAQLAQINSDTEYNKSKKIVMENARKDNLRIQSADKWGQFMSYISAGGGVPSREDFMNMRNITWSIMTEQNPEMKVPTTTDVTKL